MHDLKVVVEEIKGFCDLPMKQGDFFEVKGGRIIIPPGKHMCLWALQSLMPFLPLKQRRIQEDNDWVPYTKRICCPDPNGMVIYRIDIAGDKNSEQEIVRERMLVDESKCTGCKECELACKEQAIHVEQLSPKVCRQCGNAPCINVCPKHALSKNPITKAIQIDSELCIGCGLCSKACPFDSISFDQNNKVRICNLCSGEPNCVQKCSTGAIAFGRKGETC
jgi:anaerobic carbon-monoxide dehydrogenase iron sulfur subunit